MPTAKRGTSAPTLDEATEALLRGLLHPEEAGRREDGIRLGSRGAATRQRLMDAARAIFEENGYGQTSVAQISERAGVSQGAFYQYFSDRAHVMSALVHEAVGQLLRSPELVWHVEEGRAGLARLLDAWVASYAHNAAFQRVWEEVSQIEPALAEARRHLTRLIEHTIAVQLSRGADEGLLALPTDVLGTARALTAMTDRYCYLTYAFGTDTHTVPPAPSETAELLVELWSRALALPTPR